MKKAPLSLLATIIGTMIATAAHADTVSYTCKSTYIGNQIQNDITFSWDSGNAKSFTMAFTNAVGAKETETLENKSDDPSQINVHQIDFVDEIATLGTGTYFNITVDLKAGGTMERYHRDPEAGSDYADTNFTISSCATTPAATQ